MPKRGLNAIRPLLAAKPGAIEEYPFGPQAMVFKVGGKMFAIVGHTADPVTVSLKCDPDQAADLRRSYPAITAGYHLNKRHWNTVTLDGTVPDSLLRAMVDSSFDLVAGARPRAKRR
jgi:predicted DNA-binding protein (MmcQ/YjbR family)